VPRARPRRARPRPLRPRALSRRALDVCAAAARRRCHMRRGRRQGTRR
jgi:hypothetical protein